MSALAISELQELALELSKGLPLTPANLSRVAKQTDQASAGWAFEQWALRKRGLAKFAKAESMLFTKAGLEMATHEVVARWRASRFPLGSQVVDLTCGIGGDLLGLASCLCATGFEVDEVAASYARNNLAVNGVEAEVILGDGLSLAGGSSQFSLADPMRRDGRGRMSDPSLFVPDPLSVAGWMDGRELGAIKLSPMLADEYLELLGRGLEFVSHQGECCEALVWCGAEALPGRRAVHVESGQMIEAGSLPTVSPLFDFVVEVDPAAIRAHCLGAWPVHFELGDSHGYLTTSQPVNSVWLTNFGVVWAGPYHQKKVEGACRLHDLKVTAVKKRRVDLEPSQVMKGLKSSGSRACVLILYPEGKRVMAVLACSV